MSELNTPIVHVMYMFMMESRAATNTSFKAPDIHMP